MGTPSRVPIGTPDVGVIVGIVRVAPIWSRGVIAVHIRTLVLSATSALVIGARAQRGSRCMCT